MTRKWGYHCAQVYAWRASTIPLLETRRARASGSTRRAQIDGVGGAGISRASSLAAQMRSPQRQTCSWVLNMISARARKRRVMCVIYMRRKRDTRGILYHYLRVREESAALRGGRDPRGRRQCVARTGMRSLWRLLQLILLYIRRAFNRAQRDLSRADCDT